MEASNSLVGPDALLAAGAGKLVPGFRGSSGDVRVLESKPGLPALLPLTFAPRFRPIAIIFT